ncbi:MAG: caspase family protein, partial [Thermodesulfobacteriota bacterium]|nr:caspase family protein [Thermodesulfobacteriota bacterium]
MKRIVSITLFLASVLLWAAAGSYGNEGRAIKRISDLTHESGKLGGFHALIVAISDYQDDEIPDLKSPIKDARALDRVLRKNYGFETQLLLDREATRETIYNTLRNLADSTKEDDSILIYYAGHGDRDRTYDDGWWIPADASAGRPTTYLDNTQVQKAMR